MHICLSCTHSRCSPVQIRMGLTLFQAYCHTPATISYIYVVLGTVSNLEMCQVICKDCIHHSMWQFMSQGSWDQPPADTETQLIQLFSWSLPVYWRRKWQPTQVLLPGKFHGWRNLVGYSPWGCKESDTTVNDLTFPLYSIYGLSHLLSFKSKTYTSLSWPIAS